MITNLQMDLRFKLYSLSFPLTKREAVLGPLDLAHLAAHPALQHRRLARRHLRVPRHRQEVLPLASRQT